MCALERSEKGMDYFMEENKKIEVVTGDSSNLNISPVYDNIKDAKPKSATKKTKNVVVPEESHKQNKVSKKK